MQIGKKNSPCWDFCHSCFLAPWCGTPSELHPHHRLPSKSPKAKVAPLMVGVRGKGSSKHSLANHMQHAYGQPHRQFGSQSAAKVSVATYQPQGWHAHPMQYPNSRLQETVSSQSAQTYQTQGYHAHPMQYPNSSLQETVSSQSAPTYQPQGWHAHPVQHPNSSLQETVSRNCWPSAPSGMVPEGVEDQQLEASTWKQGRPLKGAPTIPQAHGRKANASPTSTGTLFFPSHFASCHQMGQSSRHAGD